MQRWKLMSVMALLAATQGCTRWKHVPVPVPPAPPNVVSDLSRVRLTNGQSVGFLTLVVATDSVFGVRNNLARTRLTISHDQVRRIEVRQKDAFKTLAVIAIVVAGAYYSGALGLGPNR